MVALLGLLGLGRNRALVFAAVAFTVIGVVPLKFTRQWLDNLHEGQAVRMRAMHETVSWQAASQPAESEIANGPAPLDYTSHSLSSYWNQLWASANVPLLARLPGVAAAGVFLLPIGIWVSMKVYRSPAREGFALVYLLWLAGLATFWMPDSNDYNLIFLPVAAWIVWSRGNSPFVRVSLVALFLFFQPWNLRLTPQFLFAVKFLAVGGIGLGIAQAARLSGQVPDVPEPAVEPVPA
jgi:hypothetical protein